MAAMQMPTFVPTARADMCGQSPSRKSSARRSTTSEMMHNKALGIRSSFTRPRGWVLVFGWSLACCAGLVNVAAFRSWGLYVSHVTGATTAIGMHLEGFQQGRHNFENLGDAIYITASFLAGAFLCGLLIDKNQVHFGGKAFYGFALVFNSALLIAATLINVHPSGACLAAAACGLQNAMCTSHFGAVVRTTHVTGTVTDIGSTCGRMAMIFLRKGCRRLHLNVVERAEVGVDARKLLVLGPMWLCFFFGCILGAYLETKMGVYAMLVPASITGLVGMFYMLFRQRLKDYAKKIQRNRINKDLEDMKDGLERTKAALNTIRMSRQSARAGATPETNKHDLELDVGEDIEDMLETIRNVEENVGQLSHDDSDRPIRSASAVF